MKTFTTLSKSEMNQVLGGVTFCEWWVGFADQRGLQCKDALMPTMMNLDANYSHLSNSEKLDLVKQLYADYKARQGS